MVDKNKTIFIEQLNVLTYIAYVIFYKNKPLEVVCVNISPFFFAVIQFFERLDIQLLDHLHQIRYSEYPGSWYEQVEETGLNVNDKLFEKYFNNIYVALALKFGDNTDYSLAVKKEMYNRYTFSRVKTHIFLKRLSERNDILIFFPEDTENIDSLLSKKQQAVCKVYIPFYYSLLLKIIAFLKTFFAVFLCPLILCYIAVRYLFNGITAKPIQKKTYTYGIDTYGMGIPWKVPYHSFFIYNKTDFHPSKVLTVLRSPLTDEKSRRVYEKCNTPYAVLNTQKTPLDFYVFRILFTMLVGQTKNLVVGLLTFNKNPVFLLSSMAVIRITLETEIFYRHYNVNVFISRDDYSSRHIIRTLVAHDNFARTIGFMHGDYSIPGTESITDLLFDNYAIYGNYYLARHKHGLSRCAPVITGAGMYGLDKTFKLAQKGYVPEKYREIKTSYKIFLIIGGPFMSDTEACFTKDLMIQYYNDILNLTDEYNDYFRIIKPPPGEDGLDTELREIISSHDRVIVDKDLWTYKIILLADLTICYASCTVGLESILAGKKVTFYDLYQYENHAYKNYSPYLVAQTFNELKKNLNYLIKENKSMDTDTLELIRREHGFRFDGLAVHRFRQLCRSLLRSLKK